LPAARADTPAPGYQLAAQPSPAAYAVTCSLPGGDIVTFDGLSVDRWTAAGGYVGNLATLPAFVFASFATTTPDGSGVVVGESSNGDLLLVAADGSGTTPLVQLAYNYGAAWLPSGDLVVSAATGGLGAGNDLFQVRLSPPAATLLGHVDGASGPVAVSPDGALYYATQSDSFPPPPGSTDVLRWSAAQVQAGGLQEQNAQTIGSGFEGGSSLAVDPLGGGVYLAETNFGLSLYRIVRVGPTPQTSPVVMDSGLAYVSDLQLLDGGGPGSFDPWQPDDGMLLRYNTGLELTTVRPARPLLSATGPGTSGAGRVTFTLTGGVPGGKMFVAACPRAHLLPQPIVVPLPTFLYVTSFTLAKTRRGSSLLPLDASGNGSFVVQNAGNLQGKYGWQFLVADSTGTFLGSTNQVQF
jgi:hypothetical protein